MIHRFDLKKFFTIVVVWVISTSFLTIAYAAEEAVHFQSVNNIGTIFVDEWFGTKATSLDALFHAYQTRGADEDVEMTNVKIAVEANQIKFSGTLLHNGRSLIIDTEGNICKNEPTERMVLCDTLILGEMADVNNIHFVQLRIDKDTTAPFMSIVLEDTDTDELLYFQTAIDLALFDELYSISQNSLKGTALEEKFIKLYSVAANLTTPPSNRAQHYVTSEIQTTNDMEPLATSFAGWSKLIDDLKAQGSVKHSDYANIIDTSVFKGNGWTFDDKTGTLLYSSLPPVAFLMAAKPSIFQILLYLIL